MKGTLGFGVIVSPSPDPISLALDAALILGPIIVNLLRGTDHLQANQITPVQNKFHTQVLAPTVEAKDNPATPIEDLLYWLDTMKAEGDAFYLFTQKFGVAGKQARETIFGIEDATGDWITTTAAPGYATQIMRGLEDVLTERTGNEMYQQLGIDWGRIAQLGVQIAAGITGQPAVVGANGQVITGVPPSQRVGYPAVLPSTMPDWILPVGIGLVALVLLTGRRR